MSRDHRLFPRGLELAPPAQPADQAAGARVSSCSRRSCCRRSSCPCWPSRSSSRRGRPGSCGRSSRAMRIPALLLLSIVVVNASSSRARRTCWSRSGRSSITREGLTFGLISAGRVLVAFLASVTFLFTTLADDLLEALIAPRREPPDRVRRAVGGPDGAADAGAGRRDPRGPAGARPVGRRVVRAAHPGARAAHRAGAARVARGRPRADVRARGARVRGAAGPDGVPGRRRTRRSTGGCGCSSCVACGRGRRWSRSGSADDR